MSIVELVVRAGALGAAWSLLLWGAWLVTWHWMPTTRIDLRWLAVILTQLAANAVIVQILGLTGQLTISRYLAICSMLGVAAWWRAGGESLPRMASELTRLAQSWLAAPFGLGWVAAGALVLFACRDALVRGVDSLSIHGPMIVEWVQSGRVELLSFWNYPQAWEYQLASCLLVIDSDVLIVLPRVWTALLLALATSEIGGLLLLPAYLRRLCGWCVALSAVVWGLEGEGSLKADVLFAVALLTGCLALLHRGKPMLLAVLSAAFLVSTKPSGFIYAGLLAGGWVLTRHRARFEGWRPFPIVASLLLLLSSSAVQICNWVERGSPVYPHTLEIAGVELFSGQTDLSGTSILEHLGAWDTWSLWLRGGMARGGPELPAVLLAALLGAVLFVARRRGTSPRTVATITALALLWLLYIATPWSRGHRPDDTAFLRNGLTLRYGLAALAGAYALALSSAVQLLGRRRAGTVTFAIWTVLLGWRLWQCAPSVELLAAGFGLALTSSLALLAVVTARRPTRWPRTCLAILSVVSLLAFARAQEAMRVSSWETDLHPIWREVWGRAPASLLIGLGEARALRRYVLYGPRLDHRLVGLDLASPIPSAVDLVYLSARARQRHQLARQLKPLEATGWKPVASAARGSGVLLER